MSTCWRLLPYGRRHGRSLLGLTGLVGAGILFELLKPWPLKLIIDNVIKGQPLSGTAAGIANSINATSPSAMLAWLAGVTIIIFAVGWLLSIAQAYLQTRVGTAMVYDLAGDLFRRLQRLSLPFHSRRRTGDLVKRVTSDCTCARDLFINVLLPSLSSVLTLVGMTFILWRLNPALAALSLVVIPFLAGCIWYFSKSMTERTQEQYNVQGEVSATANEILSVVPLVRVFGQTDEEQKQFGALAEKADNAALRATRSQLKFKLSVATITSSAVAAVITFGGFQVLQGKLTIGGLLVFLTYLNSLYGPLETLAYLSTGWAAATAGAHRVFEVFDSTEVVAEPSHPKRFPGAFGTAANIEFRNVVFGYDSKKIVLNDVSFKIEAGETVALVGPSGAGKTALISLLPRLFDPWHGKVLINGVDVREVTLADLRSKISIVLQDDLILPLSVAENIAYGYPNASLSEIERAAEAAQADTFIRRLAQGYDTVLGERGQTLSGGERQRLSLARAFLKPAPILVMDEPTSALDGETESGVMGHLSEFGKSRTVFLIAHRLSTVSRADRILVLDRGHIVEAGTHRELLQRDGMYARLRHSQAGRNTTSNVVTA